MFSLHSTEESSSFQTSFSVGIETFLKKTLCSESVLSFLTVYVPKWLEASAAGMLSAFKICWQGKKQVKIIFFYCEAPREKAVPELIVSLPFG